MARTMTKAQLEAAYADLRSQHEVLITTHANFREKVAEMALEVKEDNGWCDSGFEAAMEELGLEELAKPQPVEKIVVLTIKLNTEDGSYSEVYNPKNMDDHDWATFACDYFRDAYVQPGDLESYEVKEVPQDN